MDHHNMQQYRNNAHPHVFWVDVPAAAASPLPPPRPVKKRRDGIWLCLFAVTILVFMALAGAGLGVFKVLQLQKDLERMKKLSASSELSSVLERRIGGPDLTASKQHPKQAAHLTGKSNTNSLPLDWEDTVGQAFLDGVFYVNRGLVINETGLYFVYSTVYFRFLSCQNTPLIHTVFKRAPRPGSEKILLESRNNNYCGNNGKWSRSSTLAAVFNLTRFDSVYVNVSDVSLVGFEETKTIFGLYKL
ncbi:tumor necrosis factor ligand superfamily member 6-like [Ambystoma mexicanum]|uniref:tumor necrosis factor ligand superfamily member 6-like n=1 Tax=Ambystoma mexicanum TaxID=8296 RepID=UPI0037E7DF7A